MDIGVNINVEIGAYIGTDADGSEVVCEGTRDALSGCVSEHVSDRVSWRVHERGRVSA